MGRASHTSPVKLLLALAGGVRIRAAMLFRRRTFAAVAGLALFALAAGLPAASPSASPVAKLQQLEQLLPSPNAQRNAAGAPGPGYWQNRADYRIEASLDEQTHRLAGRATITYHNASPDPLTYLWLQLDANYFARDSDSRRLARAPADLTRVPYRTLQEMLTAETYASDLAVRELQDASGRPLPHTIVKTDRKSVV